MEHGGSTEPNLRYDVIMNSWFLGQRPQFSVFFFSPLSIPPWRCMCIWACPCDSTCLSLCVLSPFSCTEGGSLSSSSGSIEHLLVPPLLSLSRLLMVQQYYSQFLFWSGPLLFLLSTNTPPSFGELILPHSNHVILMAAHHSHLPDMRQNIINDSTLFSWPQNFVQGEHKTKPS